MARAANGLDALRAIDELAPQVVFLDIQMPGLNGLQLAARLVADSAAPGSAPISARAPRVVFTTAYEQYALQAFDNAAFDYLLKPIRQERLQRTVARLREALAEPTRLDAPADPGAVAQLANLLRQLGVSGAPGVSSTPAGAAPTAQPLRWIRAAQGQETRLIAVDEVIYFQSNDKYTSVFVAEGEHLIRTPLRQLREQLDAQQFWQIHRGTVVAARHVAGTRTDFRGRLLVRLKSRPEELVVSRNYEDLFRQM